MSKKDRRDKRRQQTNQRIVKYSTLIVVDGVVMDQT